MKRPGIAARLLILAPSLAALVLGASLWLEYRRFLAEPLAVAESDVSFVIPRGASLRQIADGLVADGHLRHPHFFIAHAYLTGQATRLQAGEYRWSGAMTAPEVLALFASGRVVQHSITIVEGWTLRRALAALAALESLSGDLDGVSDEALMTQLGRPAQHPEGRFFPDTYYFTRGTARIAILRRALARMDEVLAEEWGQRSDEVALKTPYEALILASIIEKETGLAEERAKVAGVFVRRLQRGMRLQADPTVVYGLGDRYQGRLRKADLRSDTPYNTYVHKGLPPTPIALPGRAAIRAALHPASGDAVYFVAKGDGSHEFSTTLEAHNRAVRQHILAED